MILLQLGDLRGPYTRVVKYTCSERFCLGRRIRQSLPLTQTPVPNSPPEIEMIFSLAAKNAATPRFGERGVESRAGGGGNGKTYIFHFRRGRALPSTSGPINCGKRYGYVPLAMAHLLWATEKTAMAVPTLSTPIALTERNIDTSVTSVAPGVYVLDKTTSGPWLNSYVGRSDTDLNARLKNWVGKYGYFKAAYMDSAAAAFDAECELFHALAPTDNAVHPARPAHSNWVCPRCYIFG